MTHRDFTKLFEWGERQEEFENSIAAAPARELYPYQQKSLDLITEAYANGDRRIALQLPTGGGKTILASSLIRQFEYFGTVYFIAPRKVLIKQTSDSFKVDGFGDVGIIQGSTRTNRLARVQVASAQTLCRRPVPENFGFAIVDECHIQCKWLYRLMALPEWQNILFIGLSATPWTKGLGKHFKTLLKPTSIRELIEHEDKYLVPPKIFCPPGPDLRGVRVQAGDFVASQLSNVVNTKEIVGDVVKTWIEKGEDRPTLVYGVDCAHAQHLQERFIEAGIQSAYMDGETPDADRKDIFADLRSGDIKILCNVRTCDTGLDLPFVSCIVDARPTKSYMLEVQTIGRGLRRSPGKTDCIVLDHSGNVRRLGDPLDIDFSGLDDGDGASAAKKSHELLYSPDAIFCHACHAQLPIPKPRICPECEEVFWAVTQVREVEGELLEYGSESTGPAAKISIEVKQHWYGSFLWHCDERGKNRGLAYHLFVAKFKEKSPYSWLTTVQPVPPSVEQRNFIRARAIAYAKAMAARNG